jgi:predicted adenylyl cyclase CyaB
VINLEIKVRTLDLDQVRSLAEAAGAKPAGVLEQEDIFYAAPKGLLKLRIIAGDHAELIAYERAVVAGSKVSDYTICKIGDPAALDQVLSRTLTRVGAVRKRRELWLLGGTRIHLDTVEGLGTFVELETEGNTRNDADTRREHAHVLSVLQLDLADSLPGSYASMLFPSWPAK